MRKLRIKVLLLTVLCFFLSSTVYLFLSYPGVQSLYVKLPREFEILGRESWVKATISYFHYHRMGRQLHSFIFPVLTSIATLAWYKQETTLGNLLIIREKRWRRQAIIKYISEALWAALNVFIGFCVFWLCGWFLPAPYDEKTNFILYLFNSDYAGQYGQWDFFIEGVWIYFCVAFLFALLSVFCISALKHKLLAFLLPLIIFNFIDVLFPIFMQYDVDLALMYFLPTLLVNPTGMFNPNLFLLCLALLFYLIVIFVCIMLWLKRKEREL